MKQQLVFGYLRIIYRYKEYSANNYFSGLFLVVWGPRAVRQYDRKAGINHAECLHCGQENHHERETWEEQQENMAVQERHV